MKDSHELSEIYKFDKQRQALVEGTRGFSVPKWAPDLAKKLDCALVEGEEWQGDNFLVKCSCSFLPSEFYAFVYLSQYRTLLDPVDVSAPKITVTNLCVFSYTVLGDSMMRSLVGCNTNAIEILTKDSRLIKLFFDCSENLDRVVAHIQHYSFFSKSYEPITASYPIFTFQTSFFSSKVFKTTWEYTLEDEFQRMDAITNWSEDFEIFENENYSYFPTYPLKILKPRSCSRSDLLKSAKFRSCSRLPTPVWIHPKTKATIARSSQPLSGICKRCEADEKLVLAVWRANRKNSTAVSTLHQSDVGNGKFMRSLHGGAGGNNFGMYVLDARSLTAARANIVKGGGYESVLFYDNATIDFLNIHNIHVVRNSYLEFSNLFINSCAPSQCDIYNTRWFEHLKSLMDGVNKVIRLVESKRSVLIHCTDGWDRTTQLVATSQLLMDPFYRTARGFCILIQKEWIAFGHKFADRTPIGRPGFDNEAAPIFLQWMDLVGQCLCQHTTAFEFTDAFLVLIVDCVFDGRFSSFLWNCEADQIRNCPKNVNAVWPYLEWNFWNSSCALHNKHYNADARKQSLLLDSSIDKMKVWEVFYCRYSQHCQNKLEVSNNLNTQFEKKDASIWRVLLCQNSMTSLRKDMLTLNDSNQQLTEYNNQHVIRDGMTRRTLAIDNKPCADEGKPYLVANLKSYAVDDYYHSKSIDDTETHNQKSKNTKKLNGITYYKTQFFYTFPKINKLFKWGRKWSVYMLSKASNVIYSYCKNGEKLI